MTSPAELPFVDPAPPRLSLASYATLLDHMHEGVYLLDRGTFIYVNHALARLAGGRPEDIIGQPLLYMIAPEDHEVVGSRYRRRAEGEPLPATYEFSVLCLDRVTRVPIFMHTAQIPTTTGFISVGTIVPLAEHATLEDSERLAIPVLQIHPHVLVVPLVGRVHAARAHLLMDRILAAIAEHRATEVVLDITGVPVVDERVAAYLVRTAAAVRLLGARMTLAGISPTIAETLVTLGTDLRTLDTTASLQDAWLAASRRLASR